MQTPLQVGLALPGCHVTWLASFRVSCSSPGHGSGVAGWGSWIGGLSHPLALHPVVCLFLGLHAVVVVLWLGGAGWRSGVPLPPLLPFLFLDLLALEQLRSGPPPGRGPSPLSFGLLCPAGVHFHPLFLCSPLSHRWLPHRRGHVVGVVLEVSFPLGPQFSPPCWVRFLVPGVILQPPRLGPVCDAPVPAL